MNQKHLLLWERMGDYHRARVKALVNLKGAENVWAGDLGAADGMYGWESGNSEGNYFCLSPKPVNKVGSLEAFSAFKKLVKKEKITHVSIPGYGRLAYLLMILWSYLSGRKVLIFAESWYPGNILLDRMKGLFLCCFTDSCFVSGERAKMHFINRLLYPSKKIRIGYSVVDNQHFSGSISEKQNPPQLLCIARFSEEKNLELLINAFKKSDLSKSWELVIAGSGPLQQKLTELVENYPISLVNWLSYTELPKIYSKASCFVLPSKFEPWGLVANEAMAAGLPIILSDKVGALPDLLVENENGWSFSSGNLEELQKLLNNLASTSPEKLASMGQKSKEIIARFSVQNWAENILSNS